MTTMTTMTTSQVLAPSRALAAPPALWAAVLWAAALAAACGRHAGLPLLRAARTGIRRGAQRRYRTVLKQTAHVRARLRDPAPSAPR